MKRSLLLISLALLAGLAAGAPPEAPRPPTDGADSAAKAARLDSMVRARQAVKQERKLRMEYLKATAGIQGPVIKPEALLALLEDSNLVLLDVRQPDEQKVSMIPKAMTLPEFAEKFRKGLPRAKRIVVYCTIGYRSGRYAMELATQGITAENLEGGLLAWSHIHGPLEVRNDAGFHTATRRVHIYSSGWNFLHPDYEAVW